MVHEIQPAPLRRQSGRDSTGPDSASVQDKMASLSYSFTQHMPAPRKKKSPFERNFPELNGKEATKSLSLEPRSKRESNKKTWEKQNIATSNLGGSVSPPSVLGAAPSGVQVPGGANLRSATAAEIVANRKEPSARAPGPVDQRAELELLSKLVPSTAPGPRASGVTGLKSAHVLRAEPSKQVMGSKPKFGAGPAESNGVQNSSSKFASQNGHREASKPSGGLLKLKPTSTGTSISSLRTLKKPIPVKESLKKEDVETVKSESEEGTEKINDSSHTDESSTDVTSSKRESGEVTDPATIAPGEDQAAYRVPGVFEFSATSLFEFRDRVDALKRQQSASKSDGLSGDTSSNHKDPGAINMRAFQTSVVSSLYMPSTLDAPQPAAIDGDEGDADENVLPPLPDADDHHKFESVLRQMGWTPEEEYEENNRAQADPEKLRWLKSNGTESSSRLYIVK